MSITPEDTSPAPVHTSLHSLAVDSEAARSQDELMDAITAVPPNIITVRNILSGMRGDVRKASLLSPSARTKNKLRTPLMAAAATGHMPIVGTVLASFGDIFTDGVEKSMVKARTKEMQRQLEMVDVEGMTLLMHASSSSSSAVFLAFSQLVQPSQFRWVIKAKDAEGMTILHHAVHGRSDETGITLANASSANERLPSTSTGSEGGTHSGPPPSTGERLAPVAEGEGPTEGERGLASLGEQFVLDPRVPIIHVVLEFARAKLWIPEYRKLLQAQDGWHRSIIEHAIMSGRTQAFEAVFKAIRRDVYDEKIDLLMNPGVESSHVQTALSRAIDTLRGTDMSKLIQEMTTNLKSDVTKRMDDSTVANKIQTFIPGNLIVIFQLLLPEFDQTGDTPLYLLLVLCFIAPFWSWGATISAKRDPDTVNTRARQTAAKHLLAMPAMFFWGIGTSSIGTNSFNWAASASAAALADNSTAFLFPLAIVVDTPPTVATIIIPALDTFFSGRGARETISVITIFFLDLMDRMKTTRAAERSRQLYGQDDISSRRISSSYPQNSTFVNANPRPVDTHNVEIGHAPAMGGAPQMMRMSVAEESPRSQRSRSHHSRADSIWGEHEDAAREL